MERRRKHLWMSPHLPGLAGPALKKTGKLSWMSFHLPDNHLEKVISVSLPQSSAGALGALSFLVFQTGTLTSSPSP